MKRIKLVLEHPVNDPINKKHGLWGHSRKGGGTHKGLDYLSPKGTPVKASEDGEVVKAGFKEGVGSYGYAVVIDHTPKAGDKERHVYTLYAHLDKKMLVRAGTKDRPVRVKKGDTIGKSGNTGTTEYYDYLAGKRKTEGGFHLHFEVIDSPKKLHWEVDWQYGNRKDPLDGYLGSTKTIEYSFTEEEMSKIRASVDARPVIDRERGTCRVDWYVGGRKLGSTDKHTKEIDLKLTTEEVEEILRNPAPPKRKPKELVCEIKI